MTDTITGAEYLEMHAGNASLGKPRKKTETTGNRAKRRREEHQICVAFNNKLITHPIAEILEYTHVDNGQVAGESVTSRKIAGGMAKQRGARAGHPDYYFYLLISGVKELVYLEMKTPTAGKELEGEQLAWQNRCITNNIKHAVCTSKDEAYSQLKEWIV